MEKLSYKFTGIPSHYIALLDGNCLKLFGYLLYHSQKLKHVSVDGWLSFPNSKVEMIFKNQKQLASGKTNGTTRKKLDEARTTLASYGIIDFKAGHVGVAPKYRINYQRIKELDHIPFEAWVEEKYMLFSGDEQDSKPLLFASAPAVEKEKEKEIEEKIDEIDDKDLPF